MPEHEPPDAVPRPLVDRLLQRFAAQARMLAELQAQVTELVRVKQQMEAQHATVREEVAKLREGYRFLVERVAHLEADMDRLVPPPGPHPDAHPWWRFWERR